MKRYTYMLVSAGILLSANSCKKFGRYTCECVSGQISGHPETELHRFTTTKERAQEKCDYLGKDAAACGAACRLLEND